jgi:hypothetical protein
MRLAGKIARATSLALLLLRASGLGASGLEGQWLLTITIPESAASKQPRTFTIRLDVSPRGDSLIGRMIITDEANRSVGGVWRQVGKRVFINYELPCADSNNPCATLALIGKMKGDTIKKGKVIVMWDTPNDRDPSLYDTSLGSFSGIRILQ